MKSKIISIFSSIGTSILGAFGGACGVACLAGGCCGSTLIFGLIGVSGSTLKIFEFLTPFFLVLTVLSLSYAFYNAYKPKPETCCETNNTDKNNSCCKKEKKANFFQSVHFLWAITILCAIMWIYPYIKHTDNSKTSCSNTTQTLDILKTKSSCSNSTQLIDTLKTSSCCPVQDTTDL